MTTCFEKKLFIRLTVPVFRERLSIFVCVLRSFEFIFSHLKKGGVTGVAHFIIVNRLNKTVFAIFIW